MTSASPSLGIRIGSGLTGALRILLGVLWIHEAVIKYRAGFDGADIRLVADSTTTNTRVPEFFTLFSDGIMHPLSDLFGVLMPALEMLLGILLILGVLTLPATIGSTLTLAIYWSADLLVTQYPIMVALGVVLLLFPLAATRYSATHLWVGRRRGATGPSLALSPPSRWL